MCVLELKYYYLAFTYHYQAFYYLDFLTILFINSDFFLLFKIKKRNKQGKRIENVLLFLEIILI